MIRSLFLVFIFFITSCNFKKESSVNDISNVLDAWHLAAANADFDTYFGLLTDDAIFLGTDASENWDKKTFEDFSRPYFEKGKAWAFKPYNRNVYFSEDGTIAWFDELLNTWMKTCRGSGVLIKKDGMWKIKHYNLAVTVPNDIVKDYLKLLSDSIK